MKRIKVCDDMVEIWVRDSVKKSMEKSMEKSTSSTNMKKVVTIL